MGPFLVGLLLIGCIQAKPQGSGANPQLLCTDFRGYRCVPTLECKLSEIDDNVEDEIFNLNATDGAPFLGIRNAVRAEDASCFPVDIRQGPTNGDVICCKEENILTKSPIESGIQLCSQVSDQGYRCVERGSCLNTIDPRKQGDIFAGQDLVYFCPEKDQVCCKETVKEATSEGPKLCSEFSSLGFECIARKSCKEIDPRKAAIAFDQAVNAECPGIRQDNSENEFICCHKDQLALQPEAPSTCEQFASEGYKCTLTEDCNLTVDERIARRAVKPESASCSGNNQVCCHRNNVKKVEPPVEKVNCNVYARDGFDCTRSNECLDGILGHNGEGLVTIRSGGADFSEDGSYEPAEASCPAHEDGSAQVCCLNKKKIETVTPSKTCQEITGYSCLPLQQCSDEILKSQDDDVLDIRNSGKFVEISPQPQLCPDSDLLLCCKPKAKPLPKPAGNVSIVVNPKKYVPKCGQHNKSGLEIRVTSPRDGKFATHFGEWPHVCILYKKENDGTDTFVGGASIIAPGVIITAAHKVDDVPLHNIKVRCGEWDLKHTSELKAHQERGIESVTVHPEYSGKKRVENDVALLHLDVELTLDNHVDTICLPPNPNQRVGQYSAQNCVVMGWGRDSFKTGSFQESLKQIKLPIVPNDRCQQNLRDTRLSDTFKLHQSFLCAGGEGFQDACEGDGGGPLVCASINDPERFHLAGIVAWGIGCGTPNVPGVYASVTDALCFIHWATKCKHGSKYSNFYNYPQCDKWIEEEITSLERSSDPLANNYLKKARQLFDQCQQDISNLAKRIIESD